MGRERPVATLEPGRYVRFTIRDTGTGIAPEHLARIFDPYFTTKNTGSGLGLATAYSIIKKHDGAIQVESVIGVGTAFHIYLPAASPVQPVAAPQTTEVTRGPAGPVATGSRGRILFMDDEVILQELVGAMIEYLGYEVVCAANGEEALARFQEARTAGCAVQRGHRGPDGARRAWAGTRRSSVARARPGGAGHRVERVFERPGARQLPQPRVHRRHRQAVPDGGTRQGAGRSDRVPEW